MKTAFVIAGRAPAWVLDQTRYAAQQLTDDGRVMVAFTDRFGTDLHLPGQMGGSTLLGIAASGYPLWTGRTTSVLGLRRHQQRVVIVLFDGMRRLLVLLTAVVARARRELVIVHDLSTSTAVPSRRRRWVNRLTRSLATSTVVTKGPVVTSDRAVALAVCDGDREFARLLVNASQAMAAETASGWRIVVQSTDPEIDRLVAASARTDLLSCESGPVATDLLHMSDVVIVRNGEDCHLAKRVLATGAAAVIVGHPVGERISRRFDGAWLARADPSSILVAIESARGSIYGGGRSAPEARSDGDELVRIVRQESAVLA